MSGQLEIQIVEARLVRIFDSLKPHQDVFVQLVCGYDDGSEKVVGRTETHKQGNLNPRWSQTFNCGRDPSRGGRTLKFKVHVDHVWRSSVLCGEAEFGLDMLWRKAGQRPQEVPVPLFKKGEQTGVLSIRIASQGAAPQASPHSGMPVGYEPGSPTAGVMSQGGGRPSGPGGRGYHGSVDRPAAAPTYSENASYPSAGRPLSADHPSLAAAVGAQSPDAPWLQKENSGSFSHPSSAAKMQQEQQLREQQLREHQTREQQLREHQLREQQLREQQLREQQQQQLREQQLREQQLREQQQREQQRQQQQMREQQRLPQQQLPQQRYSSQGAAEQLSEQQKQRQPQAQLPLHPSEKSAGQFLAPPNRAAPEVKGGSCGWCGRAEASPKAAGGQSTAAEGTAPTTSSPGGQSGQWWNSFIDRG